MFAESLNLHPAAMMNQHVNPPPVTLLKEQFDLLLPSICSIVNLSLESGYLPSSLKSAVLNPLLKKPDRDHEVLSSFRPI